MARILVDESAAFRHRIPEIERPYSDREAGDRKLGTVAKGLALGEGVATSKALGALLAGGMRLWDTATADDGTTKEEVKPSMPDPVATAAAKRLGITGDKRAGLAGMKAAEDARIAQEDEEHVLNMMGDRLASIADGTKVVRAPKVIGDTVVPSIKTAKARALTKSERDQMRELDARLSAMQGREDTAWMTKAKEFLASEPTGTPAQQERHRARQRMLEERLKGTPGFAMPTKEEGTDTEVEMASTRPVTYGMGARESRATREGTVPSAEPDELERRFPVTTKPSVIMAYARTASTPAAKARVMEMAANADVYPTSLADMATGGYRRRFESEVSKLFSKAGDDELLPYKKENYRSQIQRRNDQTQQGRERLDFDQGKLRDTLAIRAAELEERKRQNRRQVALGYAGLRNARNIQELRLQYESAKSSLDTAERDLTEDRKQLRSLEEQVLGPALEVDPNLRASADEADIEYKKAAAETDVLKRPSDQVLEGMRREAASRRAALQRAEQEARKYNADREKKRQALMPGGLSALGFGGMDDESLKFEIARRKLDEEVRKREIELARKKGGR